MPLPKISVIMPTKNREKEIKNTIKSIINQTFRDWELIVIDDHSTDQTAQIVKNLQDKRIKYYFLEKGTGPGAARDFGIRQALTRIIALADSDDINAPERLVLTYDYFQKNPEVDIVYGRSNTINTATGKIASRPTCEFNKELLKAYNFISNVTIAFKKDSYLKTLGYDKKIKTSEDYDLWLTFLEKGYQFGFIDKPMVLQKIHPQSVTSQTQRKLRQENLAYVRTKHHLKTPKFEEVKKIVPNKELLKFISTPKAIEFWFEK